MSIYDELLTEYREALQEAKRAQKRLWGGLIFIGFVGLLMWGTHDTAEAIKALAVLIAWIAVYGYRQLSDISARLALTNRLLLGLAEQSPSRSGREVAAFMAD